MKQPPQAHEPAAIYTVTPRTSGSRSQDPLPALQRAAQRARRIAEQTGTDLIQVHDGKVVRVPPTRRPDQ